MQRDVYGRRGERRARRLFIDMGGGHYHECTGRIVDPYTPPSIQPNIKELKIVNAPSHLQQMHASAYKCNLNLFFKNKQDYAEYMLMIGFPHKFYDEVGNVFIGVVESAKLVQKEAFSKFMVEVSLLLVKKDSFNIPKPVEFSDIAGHWAEQDIIEMAEKGLVAIVTRDGQPVVYFRPSEFITRAEFIAFLNRTRRLLTAYFRE